MNIAVVNGTRPVSGRAGGRVTKNDLEWAVKLAARYLWSDRGDEGTQRLIEVLRDAGKNRKKGGEQRAYVSGLVLAGALEAMIEEQREYRARRVGFDPAGAA
jgi:hypothetical protein